MIFLQKEWAWFCSLIDSTKCITVSELPKLSSDDEYLVIKHDVETNVERALKIAEIEAKHGIRATFFIQSYLLEGSKNLLKNI